MKEIYYHTVCNQYGSILSKEDPSVISENGVQYYLVVDIVGIRYQFPIEQTMFEIKEWECPDNIENIQYRYRDAVREMLGYSTGIANKNKK